MFVGLQYPRGSGLLACPALRHCAGGWDCTEWQLSHQLFAIGVALPRPYRSHVHVMAVYSLGHQQLLSLPATALKAAVDHIPGLVSAVSQATHV